LSSNMKSQIKYTCKQRTI